VLHAVPDGQFAFVVQLISHVESPCPPKPV
jgi:hypothetical protein